MIAKALRQTSNEGNNQVCAIMNGSLQVTVDSTEEDGLQSALEQEIIHLIEQGTLRVDKEEEDDELETSHDP